MSVSNREVLSTFLCSFLLFCRPVHFSFATFVLSYSLVRHPCVRLSSLRWTGRHESFLCLPLCFSYSFPAIERVCGTVSSQGQTGRWTVTQTREKCNHETHQRGPNPNAARRGNSLASPLCVGCDDPSPFGSRFLFHPSYYFFSFCFFFVSFYSFFLSVSTLQIYYPLASCMKIQNAFLPNMPCC